MFKYRVHEVAKDLNVPNKEVLDALQKYCGDGKKHMTALTEEELDVVFESFTQSHAARSFDEYFASGSEPKVTVTVEAEPSAPAAAPAAQAPAQKPARPAAPAQRPAAQNDRPQRPAAQNDRGGDRRPNDRGDRRSDRPNGQNGQNGHNGANNGNHNDRRPNDRRGDRPNDRQRQPQQAQNGQQRQSQQAARPAAQQPAAKAAAPAQQPARPAAPQQQNDRTDNVVRRSEGRIVDTRASHVELEKYNEKYDRLASEKMKVDNTVQKQKLTQRSSQYRGKPKGSRKETEAERMRRIALERKQKHMTIQVPDEITVGELALRLKATAAEVIKKLMGLGVFAAINDVIDFDTASLVAMEFHAKVEKEVVVTIEERIIDDSEDDDANLVPRAPVVVVMGHVDHGKTSLLDRIRNAHVTATEAGGITQHIGAYRVQLGDRTITFLDTPGHAAFTTMRARGAQVTDIAILVVAADDGIMPQTIEAINHAKAANVSIIVAINKMDKPGANPDHVLQQLTEHELVPEEWGGDTPCIPVSALTGQGIDDLLEMVTLVADMKELKANPDRAAKGTVIEARLDRGRGPVATVLVQNGTLHTGDIVVAGTAVGRVRAMTDERGRRIQSAGPSVPVEVTGLDDVPTGGDIFNAVSDERLARELVEQRRSEQKEEMFNSRTKVTLDNLFDQMQQGEMKELKIIVKADVQGSVEAVRQSLEKLTNDEVRVVVIHGGVGAINESDVMLANASNAIIVGFNVRPDPVAEANAKRDNVDMRLYRIIYDCIDEIESAMKGMLAPKFREVALGRAEVREVYKISSVGTIAGSHVTSGKITRAAQIRVVRDGIVITEDKIASLRRFKDDVKEVADGFDCGIGLERFNDIKEGDILEAFIMEEYREA
ncbi:MAG: translation initiation factor IF-2 [Clostridiales bacterium]|nr:translation initiation factor IF-2 [Clostridiales bacterium]